MSTWTLVRATIHIPGLAAGAVAFVDTEDELIVGWLAARILVPVDDENGG